MEDTLLIDAVERLVKGEMSEQERIYFDDLRKNNPELDQTVVEHIFFLNELENFSAAKSFRHTLMEVETKLTEEGFISRQPAPAVQQGKVITLWKKYKRTIAVAASIAGFVSLIVAGISTAVTTKPNEDIKFLSAKVDAQENKTKVIENKINKLQANQSQTATPVIPVLPFESKFRATGFVIDASNNYLVTNAHVINQAKNHLIIEDNKGNQYEAKTVYIDAPTDLAIIQVTDKTFKKLPPAPYVFRKSGAELGEQIFMLGYPKQEIVYGEGYISAKNGYQMDTIYCQLSTSANEGNSGSPVVTKNGELIGIITSMETAASGVVFAIKSANIFRAVDEVKKMKQHSGIKINSASKLKGMAREGQIKKMEDYVFMIKGN